MDLELRMKKFVHEFKILKPKVYPKDFIIRISDGINFWKSDRYSICGIGDIGAKAIMNSCEKGDRIWFCTNNSGGQLIAVATFNKIIPRFRDIDKYDMLTNEEFGWKEEGWECNYLIKYTNRYNLEYDKILSGIKGKCTTRCIDNKKNFCPTNINLGEIYKNLLS